jgi:hypothetical protein
MVGDTIDEHDYNGLLYFYRQVQELYYLMREVNEAKALKFEEAKRRADQQWRAVAALVEQMALDEQRPGRMIEVSQEGVK